ncbi:hypothetical protein ACSVDA_24345 [Cytobacillus sp. Hm23]
MDTYLFTMTMVCCMCMMIVLIESDIEVSGLFIREPIQTVPFLTPQSLADPDSLITEEFL